VSVRQSARLSVSLSRRSTAAAACGGWLVAERGAGRGYQLIAAVDGEFAVNRQLSIDVSCGRRRSAANAGSVMLRAEGRGSAQSCQ